MPALPADKVTKVLLNSSGARLKDNIDAKFKPGDRVQAHNINPTGHTRIPRYVRGRQGVIDRDHGVFIFPDTHARNGAQKPQHVYSVRFSARELWGEDAPEREAIYVDLWDDYLSLINTTDQ